MPRCKFFAQGRCARGETCPYFHTSLSNPPESPPTGLNIATRSTEMGSNLRDRKPADPSPMTENSHLLRRYPIIPRQAQTERDSHPATPCRGALFGDCQKGDDCAGSHARESQRFGDTAIKGSKADENEDIEKDDFSREILGAFVQFGDGGSVSKVNLPMDFTTVCIRGFPPCSTPASVSSRLNDLGFEKVSPECVEVNAPFQTSATDAYVTVEDPTFPKAVYEVLKDQKHIKDGLRIIRTTTPTIISTSISRRITRKRVYLSWARPTRTARLSFENKGAADRVHKKFCRSVYKVLDQPVSASEPKYSRLDDPNIPRGNHGSWTVVLKDVPLDAGYRDVERSIRSERDRPRHIGFARLNHECDPSNTPSAIAAVLTTFGLTEFGLKGSHQNYRIKAVASFHSESSARKAVGALHDTRQKCLNGGELTMQLASSAKFKIPTAVYDSLETQLTAQGSLCKQRDIEYNVRRNTDSRKRFTTLLLESTKNIERAVRRFEKIFAGELLKGEDRPLWSSAFAGNGETYHLLKQIQQTHGISIIRDRMKKQLTFFGPPEKYHQVQQEIMELVESEPVATHVIPLDSYELPWLSKGGIEHLKAALGNEGVSLDTSSELPNVIVTGSAKKYQIALAIIQGKPHGKFQGGTTCAVCWTEAENPIVTTCNHTYCTECFENLCVSSKSANKPFSIGCQGETGKCARVFSLRELQYHLTSSTFEDILEASFSSYISRHPLTFRSCPTPGCGFAYRCTTPDIPQAHICINCSQAVCTACHGQHNTILTCDEYKAFISDADAVFEKYKEESLTKDCPVCGTTIEKDGGCSHIQCRNCTMHLCWVCLDSFVDSDWCYSHIRAARHY